MTILTDLGAFLSARDFSKLNAADRESVRLHILDTVCASVVGARTPDGVEALSFQAGQQAINALTDSPLDDVATRVFLTRLSETDDIHLPSGTTPGSIIVPTALILSAHLGITDSNLFSSAVVAGYEAMTKLGAAVDGQSIVYKGLWTTYFTAPFGTAAVTARLLQLDEKQTAHALAIALTLLAGRMGKPGTEKTSRWLMAGHAARSGCFAALSAASDFTGDLDLLDGGWMESAHGVVTDSSRFATDADAPCIVSEISFKPYFGAKQMMANIAGFEDILARGIDPDDIDQVTVAVPENYAAMIDHGVVPGNRLSSATSAPYQLALVAYHPDALYDIARSDIIADERITSLMAKVSVEADQELATYLPGNWPARVAVTAGGRREEITVIDAPGDPARPFNLAAIQQKFHNFADVLIGEEAVGGWIGSASNAALDDEALSELQQKYLTIGR